MKKSLFGMTKFKQKAHLYTLETKDIRLTVSDIGATITNLWVKNKENKWIDIVLGYDKLEDYLMNTNTYFGATVGRNANRIESAVATIEGKKYVLSKNDGNNNLHSGVDGFQTRIWNVEEINDEKNTIIFSLISREGDQGFPGNLKICVCYQLENGQLFIKFTGKTDKTTVFNPTNHTYFNLNGHDSGDILNHVLQIKAKKFTALKENTSIPTGKFESVENTPFDFLQPKKIGKDIESSCEQLVQTNGYDHNYVIDKKEGEKIVFATVFSEDSGVQLKMSTDLPGVQLYTANFIENEYGKVNTIYQKRAGFCLETQYFPNAINEPLFVSPLLFANEEKSYTTLYQFKTIK